MSRIEAVITDFGGVLTSPLLDSFAAFQDSSGISLESLGQAMAAVAARDGANPLFELETGRMTEAQFLGSLAERADRSSSAARSSCTASASATSRTCTRTSR